MRKLFVDIIKSMAILMVISTHTIGDNQIFFKLGGPFLLDCAVPLFLIITGYNFTASLNKRNMVNLKDYFKSSYFINRLKKIILPVLIIIVLEILYFYRIEGSLIFQDILALNWGPGSYYILLLLQLTIFFPFIYKLYNKNKYFTAFIILSINILFEYLFTLGIIDYSIYRISILRQITFLLLGMHLYKSENINAILLSFACLISFLFILNINYLGYKPRIFSGWINTSLLASAYSFFLVYFIKKCINDSKHNCSVKITQIISNSTYHIFLFQMLWFKTGWGYKLEQHLNNTFLSVALNITICTLVGVIYYYSEKQFNTFIKKKDEIYL